MPDSLSAVWYRPDFTPRLSPPLDLTPRSCTWSALGGPESAVLEGEYTPAGLGELAGLLRCPLELVDGGGEAVWWGFVSAVEVRRGRLRLRADLSELANRVSAVYLSRSNGLAGGGVSCVTGWAEDAASQARFGVKELRLEIGPATLAQAEAVRGAELARRCKIRAIPRLAASQFDLEAGIVRVEACGWYETLDWRLAVQPPGLEQHPAAAMGKHQALGDAAGSQRLAQSLTVTSSGWRGEELSLSIRRVGAPTDTFQVALHADSSGAPGAVLASAAVSGATLPISECWERFVFDPPAGPFSAGQKLWIVLSRSGSVSAAQHYRVLVDENLGYTGGVLHFWNGSAWTARSPEADLCFRLAGGTETSRQLATLAGGGEFFSAVRVSPSSALFTNPWRGGDTSLLDEINLLLKAGCAVGPYQARVSKERVLSITPHPSADNPAFILASSGELRARCGRPAEPRDQPVGQWAALEADALLSEPGWFSGRIFISRLTWTAESGLLIPGEGTR